MLTLYALIIMDSSFWIDAINLGWSIVYTVFPSLKIVLVIVANSVDPDEMPQYAAFYLGLHCLPKNTFRSHYCD